jgi:mRNA-degrading endonuclease toxin of MazEF toxin-antitoxin module
VVINANPESRRLGMGEYPDRYSSRDYVGAAHKSAYRDNPVKNITDRSLPENIERAVLVEAPERGAIYLVDFGDDKSCCLTVGARPAVCISADSYHENSPILRVVPMTKHFKSIDAGYHVFVNRDKCVGLNESGMALGEQTRPIDRSMIIKKIGVVADEGLFEEILMAADAIVKNYK